MPFSFSDLLKTSHVNVSLWPTLDGFVFQYKSGSEQCLHFHFANCRKQLIQESFVQKSMHRSPIDSNANEA